MTDTDLTPEERKIRVMEQELDSTTKLLEFYQKQEFEKKVEMLRTVSNGDWAELVRYYPDLINYIQSAIQRGKEEIIHS